MRWALAGAAAAALLFSSAGFAQQSQFPLSTMFSTLTGNSIPDGWSRNIDGSYKQTESGVLCPKQFQCYMLEGLTGPSPDAPNILGVCRYSDGAGRVGDIRIRRYVEGWGGDNEAMISNDKTLMGQDAPPMLMRHSVDRPSGGSRLTVTVVKNGLLVDCSVWQAEPTAPRRTFPLYCSALTGG